MYGTRSRTYKNRQSISSSTQLTLPVTPPPPSQEQVSPGLTRERNKKPSRSNKKSLQPQTDVELLRILISPDRHNSFLQNCKQNPHLLGWNTEDRRKARDRLRYFKLLRETRPEEFQSLCDEYRLIPMQQQQGKQQENNATEKQQRKQQALNTSSPVHPKDKSTMSLTIWKKPEVFNEAQENEEEHKQILSEFFRWDILYLCSKILF